MAALDRGGPGAQAVDVEGLPLGAERAYLLPAFGERELETIMPEDIELWRRSLTSLSNRSKNKLLIQLHGIFRRAQIVWGIPVNPLARVEKHPIWVGNSLRTLAIVRIARRLEESGYVRGGVGGFPDARSSACG